MADRQPLTLVRSQLLETDGTTELEPIDETSISIDIESPQPKKSGHKSKSTYKRLKNAYKRLSGGKSDGGKSKPTEASTTITPNSKNSSNPTSPNNDTTINTCTPTNSNTIKNVAIINYSASEADATWSPRSRELPPLPPAGSGQNSRNRTPKNGVLTPIVESGESEDNTPAPTPLQIQMKPASSW